MLSAAGVAGTAAVAFKGAFDIAAVLPGVLKLAAGGALLWAAVALLPRLAGAGSDGQASSLAASAASSAGEGAAVDIEPRPAYLESSPSTASLDTPTVAAAAEVRLPPGMHAHLATGSEQGLSGCGATGEFNAAVSFCVRAGGEVCGPLRQNATATNIWIGRA